MRLKKRLIKKCVIVHGLGLPIPLILFHLFLLVTFCSFGFHESRAHHLSLDAFWWRYLLFIHLFIYCLLTYMHSDGEIKSRPSVRTIHPLRKIWRNRTKVSASIKKFKIYLFSVTYCTNCTVPNFTVFMLRWLQFYWLREQSLLQWQQIYGSGKNPELYKFGI